MFPMKFTVNTSKSVPNGNLSVWLANSTFDSNIGIENICGEGKINFMQDYALFVSRNEV